MPAAESTGGGKVATRKAETDEEQRYRDDPVGYCVAKLKDPSPGVRTEAADHLGLFGEDARDAVPALGEALQDEDRDVRAAAALSLWKVGAVAAGTVSALMTALNDQDDEVRGTAALALGLAGPDARAALLALRSMSAVDPNGVNRVNAIEAIWRLEGDAAAVLPALAAAVEGSDWQVQEAAITTLGEIGRLAKDLVPALERAARTGNEMVRLAAEHALWQITRA